MIREIDGGSSHLSQNSTVAHFGLGTATTVDSVIVTWIGGKKQIFTNQKANVKLTIVETVEEKSLSLTRVALILGGSLILLLLYKPIKRILVKSEEQSV